MTIVSLNGIDGIAMPLAENAKETEKQESAWTESRKDTFEKEELQEYSETYTDWTYVQRRSDSPMGNTLGDSICKTANQCMLDYYAGSITQEQVLETFRDCCDTLYEYWRYATPEGEVDAAYRAHIVESVFYKFLQCNADAAVYQCVLEGDKINQNYAYTGDNDFVYYSADIYYQWKDMKGALLQSANAVGSELSGSQTEYPEARSSLDYGFNERWNWLFGRQRRLSAMADTSKEYPAGFTFFYKRSPYVEDTDSGRRQWGNVLLTVDRSSYFMDVPFISAGSVDAAWTTGQVFRLGALLYRLGEKGSEEIPESLMNFNVFTKQYGYYYYRTLGNI